MMRRCACLTNRGSKNSCTTNICTGTYCCASVATRIAMLRLAVSRVQKNWTFYSSLDRHFRLIFSSVIMPLSRQSLLRGLKKPRGRREKYGTYCLVDYRRAGRLDCRQHHARRRLWYSAEHRCRYCGCGDRWFSIWFVGARGGWFYRFAGDGYGRGGGVVMDHRQDSLGICFMWKSVCHWADAFRWVSIKL